MKKEKKSYAQNIMCSSRKLDGKTVLITGCSRGIGKEILSLFASEGACIIACIRSECKEYSKFVLSLATLYNVKIELLYFDMTDEEAIIRSLRNIVKQRISVDVLINNAGVAFGSLLQMTSMQKLKEIFQINFFSHVLVTQIISKIMIRQRGGVIINIGSIAGLENFGGYTAYGSSKAAIMFFTKTIAKELAPYNIRVNSIAPGLTDTGMAQQMEIKALDEMVSRSDMSRLGSPKEIANLALFLASDSSSFITGQIIRADGGM